MYLTSKKIMIIPGGKFQIPLVKKAKQMGLFTVVTDANENAPCKKYADVFCTASALDYEKNLEIAKRYKVDAILTDQTDTAVKTVAYLNEKLNLRGIGMEKAELFTNKLKMREFCQNHNFPHPKFKFCYTIDDVKKFAEEMKYPFIIKPLDNQSSKGVFLIHNWEELLEKFDLCKKYSSAENAILAEEFIDGVEFTVDSIKLPNNHFVLAISKKHQFKQNPMVTQKLLFSFEDNIYNYSKLREQHKNLVQAMDLPFGFTHAEYKDKKGEFYLIEIAARGGGTEISSVIAPEMSGIDNYEQLINIALGNINVLENSVPEPQVQFMLLEFFDIPCGKIKAIRGFEQIKSLPYIKTAVLNVDVNSKVEPVSNDATRTGYYIMSADTIENLQNQREKLLNMLEIEYEENF